MKLRLVESYDVRRGLTRYHIERHVGVFDRWRFVESFASKTEAKKMFNKFKDSRGEYFARVVLDEWPK